MRKFTIRLWLNVQKGFYIQNVILQRARNTVLKTMGYRASAPLFIQLWNFAEDKLHLSAEGEYEFSVFLCFPEI